MSEYNAMIFWEFVIAFVSSSYFWIVAYLIFTWWLSDWERWLISNLREKQLKRVEDGELSCEAMVQLQFTGWMTILFLPIIRLAQKFSCRNDKLSELDKEIFEKWGF